MYFLLFYLFSAMLLGSYQVGPFSIRVYLTVIMLFFLLFMYFRNNKKNVNTISKKFVYLFVLFVVMASLALVINGDYQYMNFTKLIIANYLNCIVTFFAIDYFLKGEKELKVVLIFLSVIIGTDAIVTIMQHVGNPIGQAIAFLMTTSADYKSTIIESNETSYATMFGLSLPIGIFGYVHTNATCLATFGIVPLCLFIDERKLLYKLLYATFFAISLYACFCTQERAAFGLLIIASLAIIYYSGIKKGPILIILGGLFLLIIFLLPSLLTDGSLGRITDFDSGEDTRRSIWSDAMAFIPEHILWGGPREFAKMNEIGGHNFFLNGLVNFGLIGSSVAFYLYLSMIYQSLTCCLRKLNITIQALVWAVLVYSIIGLFHNASILSGDILVFLLYPLMLKSLKMFCNRRKTSIQNRCVDSLQVVNR